MTPAAASSGDSVAMAGSAAAMPVSNERADAAPAPNAVEPPAEVVSPAEAAGRLMLLAPRGPLLVDLRVTVGGRSATAVADEVLAKARQAAGAKQEEDPRWSDLVASPKFEWGLWGNAPLIDQKARDEAARQFDRNRDGLVQVRELAAFLAQDAMLGGLIRLQSIAGQGEDLQSTPTFAWCDVDHDGRLSAEELAGAEQRLLSRDTQGDDLVTSAEMVSPGEAEQAPRGRPDFEPDLALNVGQIAGRQLYELLAEMYDEGNGLDASALSLSAPRFALLDANQNGRLDTSEMAGFQTIPADLTLRGGFAIANMANRLPTLDLEVLPGQSMPPVARRPGRLDVELNEFGLDVQTLGGNALARNLNAPFAAADADKSTFLEGDEQLRLLEALEMELGKVDRDVDRKISLEECLAATNRFTSYAALVSSVQLARSADPLFANLDADRDGRLTIRELRASGKRLIQLDRDGDGTVTPDEVPSRLSLTWSLGAVPRFDQAPGMLNPATAPRSDLPGWMQAMDRNSDGELSPREFLGTRAQFQRLDVDGDGLVSADEARAAASAGP